MGVKGDQSIISNHLLNQRWILMHLYLLKILALVSIILLKRIASKHLIRKINLVLMILKDKFKKNKNKASDLILVSILEVMINNSNKRNRDQVLSLTYKIRKIKRNKKLKRKSNKKNQKMKKVKDLVLILAGLLKELKSFLRHLNLNNQINLRNRKLNRLLKIKKK